MKRFIGFLHCFLFTYLLLINPLVSAATDDDDDDTVDDKTKSSSTANVASEITYETPKPPGLYHLYESFDYPDRYKARWVLSTAKKEDTDEEIAKYNGEWELEHSRTLNVKGDLGLVLRSKAKHHAIAVPLDKPFHFENSPLVLQYEVNFQNGQECGGAYLKLITHSPDLQLETFHDKTPYTIMFGPDKCGQDQKVHFIFRHKNPLNGSFSEKHCKRSEGKLEELFKDKKSHLYTLVIKYDNSFEIYVDQVLVNSGSLLDDFTPPVNPPEEIDDPNDRKPDSWDEREKIPDPNSKKPDDWDEDAPRQIPDPQVTKPEFWLDDEPEMIPDPNAQKPDDWDEEMDGEWEPPQISNPKCEKVGCGVWNPPMLDNPDYKGKWRAPLVANPNYRGKWKPHKIPNPDYFQDKLPFRMGSIGAVGLELWSMSDMILFDNILITSDKYVADAIAAKTWQIKQQIAEREAESLFKRIINYTNNQPWLWAVYLVVIGLPLVLIVVFCCSSEDKAAKKVAHTKKTDEVTADDESVTTQTPIQSQPHSKIEELGPIIEKKENVVEKETLSTDNEASSEVTQEEDAEKIDDVTKVKNEDEDMTEEAKEEIEEHEHAVGDSDQSPRKRKPRRE